MNKVNELNTIKYMAVLLTLAYEMGRVTSKTDPKGQRTDMIYNTVGQPETVSFYDDNDVLKETIEYAYGNNGRLESVTDTTDPNGTPHVESTSITYIANTNMIESVDDPVTGVVSYTYDSNGNVATKTIPGGGTWTYTYSTYSALPIISDDMNKISRKLVSINDDLGNVVDYNINGLGMILSVTNSRYDSQSKNTYKLKCTYSYDILATIGGNYYSRYQAVSVNNTYQITNTQYPQNNIGPYTIVDSQYDYNALGMRTSKEIWEDANKDGTASLTRTEDYEYDNLNRLTSADYGDGQIQGYTFDAMGNRMTKTDNVNGNDSYTYDNANRLLTRNSNSYTNDLNGNTLTGGGRTNTWDIQNRLTSCTYNSNTTTFTYGADGLRRSSTSGGVTTHYVLDGQSVALEWKDTDSDGIMDNNETISYLNGPRGAEYRKDNATGQVRWYLYDGLGSVIGEVDDSGNITASKKFDVYGAVRATSGTPTTKHGFVGSLGHVSEDNTGLIYMRARYMDPVTGRFASEDPAGQGANWYTYCVNNPVNFVDESGKEFDLPSVLIGSTLSGVLSMITAMVCNPGKDGWYYAKVFGIGALTACAGAINIALGIVVGSGANAWSVYREGGNESQIAAAGVFGALAGIMGGVVNTSAGDDTALVLICWVLNIGSGFATGVAEGAAGGF